MLNDSPETSCKEDEALSVIQKTQSSRPLKKLPDNVPPYVKEAFPFSGKRKRSRVIYRAKPWIDNMTVDKAPTLNDVWLELEKKRKLRRTLCYQDLLEYQLQGPEFFLERGITEPMILVAFGTIWHMRDDRLFYFPELRVNFPSPPLGFPPDKKLVEELGKEAALERTKSMPLSCRQVYMEMTPEHQVYLMP